MEIEIEGKFHEVLRRDMRMDRELVFTFFENFARAEYALKRAGYAETHSGSVTAAWDSFADFLQPRFDATTDRALKVAADYFFAQPPLKQILNNGTLGWAQPERTVQQTLRQLLVFVRRVRNNLFHGGKFPGVIHDDPVRNKELLRHGLVVLLSVLALHPDVLDHFIHDE
jgi:hypothetical protein